MAQHALTGYIIDVSIRRVAAKLGLPENERRILRLAALLHDAGHGPFSHVSEEVLRGVTGNKQAHEELTTRIILTSPELSGPLSGNDREEIVGLLKEERGDALMRSILSGPLDVDKQDYLLRDSYFCGVKYGVYDIDRLIETLCICNDKGHRELAITGDGVHTLEQFVIARYHMTGQVYRHRIRLITDSMIVRGLELGISEDNIDWLKNLYSYDGTDTFLQNYLTWDDDKLARAILDKAPQRGYAHQMFESLMNRRLFKQMLRADINSDDLSPVAKKLLLQEDPVKLRSLLMEVEKEVAKRLTGVDENLVIAQLIKQRSAAKTEATILVDRSDAQPREFREESTLFNSINAAIQEQYLHLYAPVSWADAHQKRDKLERYRREILPAIDDMLKARSSQSREVPAGDPPKGGQTDGS